MSDQRNRQRGEAQRHRQGRLSDIQDGVLQGQQELEAAVRPGEPLSNAAQDTALDFQQSLLQLQQRGPQEQQLNLQPQRRGRFHLQVQQLRQQRQQLQLLVQQLHQQHQQHQLQLLQPTQLTPQADADLTRAHTELEAMWHSTVSAARAVSVHLDMLTSDGQYLTGGADGAGSGGEEDNGQLHQVDGWTFVDRGAESIGSSRPAAPRRRAREVTPAEGLPVLHAPVPPRITRRPVQVDSLVPPTLQGPLILFDSGDENGGSGSYSGSDDMESEHDPEVPPALLVGIERDDLLSQLLHSRNGGAGGAGRDFFTLAGAQRRHAAGQGRRHGRPVTPPQPPYSKHGNVRSSVIVRQPWNSARQWRPYVYDPPMLRIGAPGGAEQAKPPGDGAAQAQQFAVHSGVGELALECTNADDMGRGSLSNMFRLNSSVFITSRPRNVHLELTLGAAARHHVVERIYVMSSMANPPCAELMVFASSRRCNFSELRKYDDFTFAQYEQLAASMARPAVDGPLPIAYFWLTFEGEYEQLQVLPQGVSCKYLYFKLLRSADENFNMSVRRIRVFGWTGPRSFAEAALC